MKAALQIVRVLGPLLSLCFIFSPEASSLEEMLPSTLITAVAMLARRYMEDEFSLDDSAMLQNFHK
jgi:hypothetical protein